jgi:hypothetical protein
MEVPPEAEWLVVPAFDIESRFNRPTSMIAQQRVELTIRKRRF